MPKEKPGTKRQSAAPTAEQSKRKKESDAGSGNVSTLDKSVPSSEENIPSTSTRSSTSSAAPTGIINLEQRPNSEEKGKIFNDPIWGPIKMNPVCVKIIDTPEFQRLRFIKQLGGGSFVYPGACHTRFEHSIGTSYLAGCLVRSLRDNMSTAQEHEEDISIDEREIICVEIAGLCHDLGHGAFSHLFDGMFIRRITGSPGAHEEASTKMLDTIIKNNLHDLQRSARDLYGLILESDSDDVQFIKDLIKGKNAQDITHAKGFLYEIVANEENKIDVDKWDYFSRDCHMLGLKHNFQVMRSIMLARVIKHGDKYHISFPKTEYMNIFDMYQERYTLHRRAYLHPVKRTVELMITDALVSANSNLKYTYREEDEEKETDLAGSFHHMEAYTHVTDGVLDRIRFEKDTTFNDAKETIERIFRRDLYKCVERRVTGKESTNDGATEEDQKLIDTWICAKKVYLEEINFNYGAKDKNPMDKVYFYSNGASATANEKEISAMLPKQFEDTFLRMYLKQNSSEEKEMATRIFKRLKGFNLNGTRYVFCEPTNQQ